MNPPESAARLVIDRQLADAGWIVQDRGAMNLYAGRGVAVREFPLASGHGFADYLLYVDGAAAGVVEAKAEGATLTGVEVQARKYSEGLPAHVPARVRPLPFLYQSTGVETRFTNRLDPEPRSRDVFTFHRPETLAQWLAGAAARGRRSPTRAAAAAALSRCCAPWAVPSSFVSAARPRARRSPNAQHPRDSWSVPVLLLQLRLQRAEARACGARGRHLQVLAGTAHAREQLRFLTPRAEPNSRHDPSAPAEDPRGLE